MRTSDPKQREKLERLQEMFKEVPLDPELQQALEETDVGTFLKHPLVVAMYLPQMHHQYNQHLAYQKEALAEAEGKEDWHSAVFIHERAFRSIAFDKYAGRLPLHTAADLLVEIWQDTEFPYSIRVWWLQQFRRYSPFSSRLRSSMKALPTKPFTVFRGMSSMEGTRRIPYGISWTLDRQIAQRFTARILQGHGVVREAIVHPAIVFGYLPERGEQEVVIDANKLPIKGLRISV